MTGFWKDMEQGIKCIRLVEQLLKEEENLLRHLQERGRATACTEYRIARMKYALGEINTPPFSHDYFHRPNKESVEEHYENI